MTHHSSSVSLHKLDDASGVLVPQVDVSAVTAADHKLTAGPIEVHPLHCEKKVKTTEDETVCANRKLLQYMFRKYSSAESQQ